VYHLFHGLVPSHVPVMVGWYTMAINHGLGRNKCGAVVAGHKGAAGVAAAVIAGGVGGTAATGSANPADWAQSARATVTQCKTERAPGERGIGHCVSGSRSHDSGSGPDGGAGRNGPAKP